MDDACYLGASGSVLSYNLYSYCENNPIIRKDDEGNFPVHIVAGVITGISWGIIPRIIKDVIRGKMSKIGDYLCDAITGVLSGLVTSLTGSSTLGTSIGTFVGEMARFLMDYAPKFKLNNYSEIIKGFLKVVINTVIATISSFIAGKIINKISTKSFSSKQIKNYFKNTKYLKSAFGIGSGGKIGRRMWFYDAGITTILYNFLT